MHNHVDIEKAYISSFAEYCAGENWSWKNGQCINDKYVVITKGLNMIVESKPYDVLTNNCQTYTNKACSNSAHSEDVQKWVGLALFGAVAFSIGSAFISND